MLHCGVFIFITCAVRWWSLTEMLWNLNGGVNHGENSGIVIGWSESMRDKGRDFRRNSRSCYMRRVVRRAVLFGENSS